MTRYREVKMQTTDSVNQRIKETGEVYLNTDELLNSLLAGNQIGSNVAVEETEETQKFNKWANILDIPLLQFETKIDHRQLQNKWKLPESYQNVDIEQIVLSKITSQESKDRAELELLMFKERGLYNLLKYLHFLVTFMRENDIVWGVGRGSSVSSYVLYLLGVHKVDSLTYRLDIQEFLK